MAGLYDWAFADTVHKTTGISANASCDLCAIVLLIWFLSPFAHPGIVDVDSGGAVNAAEGGAVSFTPIQRNWLIGAVILRRLTLGEQGKAATHFTFVCNLLAALRLVGRLREFYVTNEAKLPESGSRALLHSVYVR